LEKKTQKKKRKERERKRAVLLSHLPRREPRSLMSSHQKYKEATLSFC